MRKALLFPLDDNVEWLVRNKAGGGKYEIKSSI